MQLEKIKQRWRKLKIIRPMFWWLYRHRPSALVRRVRTWYWQRIRFPRIYKTAMDSAPLDETKVLMIEFRYDAISANLQQLERYMAADPRFSVMIRCTNGAVKHRFELYRDLQEAVAQAATAKYIIMTDGSAVFGSLPIRPETVVVQTWHACGAFKRFGMSTANKFFGANARTQRRYPPYGTTNFVTVSAPEVAWAYAEAMQRPKKYIKATGVSRTDIFYDEARKAAAYEALYEQFPAARGKKVILFAPTYRGHLVNCVTATAFRPECFAVLRDEYVLVIKHHPLVKDLPPVPEEINGTFALDVTRSMDIEDLLFTADICITDYSSIVFEYALFERPMIFFAYDLDEYYDWRGFYYPYEEMTPGPVCRTNEEMVSYIRQIDSRFDKAEVTAFKERFMSACDGHATERIVKAMYKEGLKRRGR